MQKKNEISNRIKVLHILHHSQPRMSGYSMRSKYILENQKAIGIDVVVLTSDFQTNVEKEIEVIDGINHYRVMKNKKTRKNKWIRRLSYLFPVHFISRFKEIVNSEKPDVIHFHSPFYCVIPMFFLAKKNRPSTVYEVRGIWEDTSVSNGRMKYNSFVYKMIRTIENKCYKSVDKLIVISRGLKEELLNRNLGVSDIEIVPNGVSKTFNKGKNVTNFIDSEKDEKKYRMGYIGSVSKIEGLSIIIKALSKIPNEELEFVIVGEGNDIENLKELSRELGVSNKVSFVGKVNHNEVHRFYEMIDMFVLPRVSNRVNSIVTPLKPLEIMAKGKLLVCSDVGGMVEIVIDGINGVVFRSEDIEDLILKIEKYLFNRELGNKIGSNAKEWVMKNRTWEDISIKYIEIYSKLRNDLIN